MTELVRWGSVSRCIRVVQISDLKATGKPWHRLPVFFTAQKEVGRVLVRSSKTVIFNRVAKTGSQVYLGMRVNCSMTKMSNVIKYNLYYSLSPNF